MWHAAGPPDLLRRDRPLGDRPVAREKPLQRGRTDTALDTENPRRRRRRRQPEHLPFPGQLRHLVQHPGLAGAREPLHPDHRVRRQQDQPHRLLLPLRQHRFRQASGDLLFRRERQGRALALPHAPDDLLLGPERAPDDLLLGPERAPRRQRALAGRDQVAVLAHPRALPRDEPHRCAEGGCASAGPGVDRRGGARAQGQGAATYRERRTSRWKPSSFETHDIYMRNRLMPAFGRLRLDAIDHARVSRMGPHRQPDRDLQDERRRALRLAQEHAGESRRRPSQQPHRRTPALELQAPVKLKSG